MDLYATIGSRIKHERMKRGLTQAKLAEMSGVAPTYIGVIERADKKLSVDTLVKITNALGVTLDSLMRDSGNLSAQLSRVEEMLHITEGLCEDDLAILFDVAGTIANNLKNRRK